MAKEESLAELDLKKESFRAKDFSLVLAKLQAKPDGVVLLNTSGIFKHPMLTIAFFIKEPVSGRERWLVRCEMRSDGIIKLFQRAGQVNSFLINREGELLVHKNPRETLNTKMVTFSPLIAKFKEGQLNNHQLEFEDDDGTSYLGAYKEVGWNTAVIAQLETSQALAAVMRVQYRALLVTAIVLGLAFIFNFIFFKFDDQSFGETLPRHPKGECG